MKMKQPKPSWLAFLVISVYLIFLSTPQTVLAAGTVSINGSILQFQASSNETNTLTVSLTAGVFTINDATATLTAGGGCTAVDPNNVNCVDTGVTSLDLSLGDRSDTIILSAHLDAQVDGGSGIFYTDVLSVTGTTSSDTLIISGTQVTHSGGETVTFTDIERLGVDALSGFLDTYQVYFGGLPLTVNINDSGGAFPPYIDRLYVYGTPDADSIAAITNQIGRVAFPPEIVAHNNIEWVQLNGGDGNDTINASVSTWPLVLYGDVGDDYLTTSILGGAMYGGAGNDILTGNTGPDLLIGEDGDDTYVFNDRWGLDTITENSAEGNDTLDFTAVVTDVTVTVGLFSVADPGGDLLSHGGNNLEHVELGDGNDLVLFGNGAQLAGGLGTLDGGSGDNILDYTSYTSGVTIHLGDGIATGAGGVAAFQTVRGGSGNDHLTGDSGQNILIGNGGNDSLTGGLGNDELFGSLGDDSFLYADGWGQDVVSETVNAGSDTLDLSSVTTDLSVSILGLEIQTDAGNRLTHDGSAIEAIVGGGGDDVFYFGNGDQLANSTGEINGGGGINSLDYSTCTSPISVTLDSNATGLASLINIQNVTGGSGNDVIEDNADDNILAGNDGNDVFTISSGDDELIGGSGDDHYMFMPDWGNDVVLEDAGAVDSLDTLDFSACTTGLTFTITDTLTVAGADGSQVSHPDSEIETLIGGQSPDVFNVSDAETGDLNLDGRGDSDVYRVSFDTSDRAIGVIDTGGYGQDSLYAFGLGLSADVFTLTASQIFHKGMESLDYSGVEVLTLDTSGGDDELFVYGWPDGDTLLLGGDGDDIFLFEAGGNGALVADGQAGADLYGVSIEKIASSFTLSDSGASGDDVLQCDGTSSDDSIIVSEIQISWFATATLEYAGMDSLNVYLGEGNDTATVTASADTAISLDGGLHTTGDTLYFDAQGQSVTQGAGSLSIVGKKPVMYNEFENITIFNAMYRLFLPVLMKIFPNVGP